MTTLTPNTKEPSHRVQPVEGVVPTREEKNSMSMTHCPEVARAPQAPTVVMVPTQGVNVPVRDRVHPVWCDPTQCEPMEGDTEHRGTPAEIHYGLAYGQAYIDAWGFADGSIDDTVPLVHVELEHTEQPNDLLLQLTPAEARDLAEILVRSADAIDAPPEVPEPAQSTLAHRRWCDPTGSGCYQDTENETEAHIGRRRLAPLDKDPAVSEGRRNVPDLDSLYARAIDFNGSEPYIEIRTETRTSACGDLMWLTTQEARDYAYAILIAVGDVEASR